MEYDRKTSYDRVGGHSSIMKLARGVLFLTGFVLIGTLGLLLLSAIACIS